MATHQADVLIIGGGLTGLTLAYLLQKHNKRICVVEARDRMGGRIHTLYKASNKPLEMGATWLGEKHHHLTDLLKTLGISIFKQELGNTAIYEPISTSPPQLVRLPLNDTPSFRIKGGTSALTHALSQALDTNMIYKNCPIHHIKLIDDTYTLTGSNAIFQAKTVASTLPPFLLTNSIDLSPKLPKELVEMMNQTHTWMGESIKVALTYKQPFWRDQYLSGTIMSNVGPIPEMYDHSNYEDNFFALKGFLNGAYFSVSKEERLALIMRQLRKYYGEKASNFLSYEEVVWRNEPHTFASYPQHVLPHQNNGQALFRKAFLNGHFFIAGSETAATYPGYMDGAVESAQWVYEQIT